MYPGTGSQPWSKSVRGFLEAFLQLSDSRLTYSFMLVPWKTYYVFGPGMESGSTKTRYLPSLLRSPGVYVRGLREEALGLELSPAKAVWSPMSAPFTSGPPGPSTVPGTCLMLNKYVLKWTDLLWGTLYKSASALNPQLLWGLIQCCIWEGREEKKWLGGKIAMDVCFNSMKHSFAVGLILQKSHSSSCHVPVKVLVTKWKDFIEGC